MKCLYSTLLAAVLGVGGSMNLSFAVTKAATTNASPPINAFSQQIFSECPKLKQIMSHSPIEIASLMALANQPATHCTGYAQYTLGQFYREGQHGVVQNYTQAAYWYRQAANQGNANAQYALGWLYKRGEGVIQDESAMVTWWRKAALGGNSSAQFYLAWAYNKGKGVKKNNVQAYAWMSVAVAYGVGTNLNITSAERAKLQAEAMAMRDRIGEQLSAQDQKDPKSARLAHAKALAKQYYQQSLAASSPLNQAAAKVIPPKSS